MFPTRPGEMSPTRKAMPANTARAWYELIKVGGKRKLPMPSDTDLDRLA